nr:C40 family peptidase [uncultured Cellulosilyticum sp.]
MQLKKAIMGALIAVAAIMPSLAYGQAYGTVATSTLNVREGAKTTARIVEQVQLGDVVEIIAEQGDWFKIILEDDERAYVKGEYITVHRAVATVEVNGGLNVRDYPSTSTGKVIGKLASGDEISVQYAVGDWYKINQEGFEGFVHKDYVTADFLKYLPTRTLSQVERVKLTQAQVENANTSTTKPSTSTSTTSSSVTVNTNVTGEAIVSYAKQFLGNPYAYGGNSLTNGVDCSGFTSQVMKNFGISLQRSSSAQFSNNGYSVERGNEQPGDLIFYGYNGNVSHVAIYIGGGQIIHANDERTGICISSAFSNTGKPVIGIKRVI